jgi:hypothetical protein
VRCGGVAVALVRAGAKCPFESFLVAAKKTEASPRPTLRKRVSKERARGAV